MLKNMLGNIMARILRAAIGRIATDLELLQTMQASWSSSACIGQLMKTATPYSSRTDVMNAALRVMEKDGFILELGVYKGQSLNEIARFVSPTKVYGFDTFTGLPEFWRDGFPEGAFDVSKEKLNFEKNCVLYKGLFEETLPKFLRDVQTHAALIHVDCDLYLSASSAFAILAPRILPGTVLVFDEYFNYPGWQNHEYKAFCEFLNTNNLNCKYIAYNKLGQQVAVVITA